MLQTLSTQQEASRCLREALCNCPQCGKLSTTITLNYLTGLSSTSMSDNDVTNLAYLQRLLAGAHHTPARSAGQNFLVSPAVREATVAAVRKGPRHVTELGAGVGPLTLALLRAGYTVRAVERDAALARLLTQQTDAAGLKEQLTVIPADLRSTDWRWSVPYQLVGNIPYNLSGLILRRITQLAPEPTQVILLLQREVGERLHAQPPHMHLLSVAFQLWGVAKRLMLVPASYFWPQPQVDSELLLLTPHAHRLPLPARERIIGLAKMLFQQRRKQIGGVLQAQLRLTRDDVVQRLTALQLTPTQRPQELSVTAWKELAAAFLPTA